MIKKILLVVCLVLIGCEDTVDPKPHKDDVDSDTIARKKKGEDPIVLDKEPEPEIDNFAKFKHKQIVIWDGSIDHMLDATRRNLFENSEHMKGEFIKFVKNNNIKEGSELYKENEASLLKQVLKQEAKIKEYWQNAIVPIQNNIDALNSCKTLEEWKQCKPI